MALTTCPVGALASNNPCEESGPFNRLSVTHQADRCVNFERSAESTLVLSQVSSGLWNLSASNTLSLSQNANNLRITFGLATNNLVFGLESDVIGGRIYFDHDLVLATIDGHIIIDTSGNILLRN